MKRCVFGVFILTISLVVCYVLVPRENVGCCELTVTELSDLIGVPLDPNDTLILSANKSKSIVDQASFCLFQVERAVGDTLFEIVSRMNKIDSGLKVEWYPPQWWQPDERFQEIRYVHGDASGSSAVFLYWKLVGGKYEIYTMVIPF